MPESLPLFSPIVEMMLAIIFFLQKLLPVWNQKPNTWSVYAPGMYVGIK
jgi:hypothetical protein